MPEGTSDSLWQCQPNDELAWWFYRVWSTQGEPKIIYALEERVDRVTADMDAQLMLELYKPAAIQIYNWNADWKQWRLCEIRRS